MESNGSDERKAARTRGVRPEHIIDDFRLSVIYDPEPAEMTPQRRWIAFTWCTYTSGPSIVDGFLDAEYDTGIVGYGLTHEEAVFDWFNKWTENEARK